MSEDDNTPLPPGVTLFGGFKAIDAGLYLRTVATAAAHNATVLGWGDSGDGGSEAGGTARGTGGKKKQPARAAAGLFGE